MLIADDRTWKEDMLFAILQRLNKLIEGIHFDIYQDLFFEYSLELREPKFYIYFDILPDEAYQNLWSRICEKRGTFTPYDRALKYFMRLIGYPNDPEELITLKYLQDLSAVYSGWKDIMLKKHKEKFVVVRCKTPFLEIVKIIDDRIYEELN